MNHSERRIEHEINQWGESVIWRVELTTSLAIQSSTSGLMSPDSRTKQAEAYRVDFDQSGGATNPRYTNSQAKIVVWDPLSKFSGSSGDRFWVKYMEDSDRWELIAPGGANTIPWRNDAATTCPAYGIVEITGNVANSETLTGTRPSTTFRRIYGVNTGAEVASGETGRLTFGPQSLAAYDTGSPAIGEGWGPKPGQWTLSKGFPGFTINGPTDTSNKWASVVFGPINGVIGQSTGTISAGSSSTSYKVYTGTLGSETDGGWTTVPSARNRGASIDSGKWIGLAWTNNGWDMTPLECNS